MDVLQGNSGTFVFWHININPFPDVSDNGDGVQFFNRLTPLLWKGSFEWKICMIIDSSLIYIIPLSDCECFMDYRGGYVPFYSYYSSIFVLVDQLPLVAIKILVTACPGNNYSITLI